MIPFLVKLANILDERGQHVMAREVDDLIEKLAQATSYTASWLNAHRSLQGLLKRLKEVITEPTVNKQIDNYLGSIDNLLNRAARNQITPDVVDWSASAWEEFKGVLRAIYTQIPERTGLREAFRDLDLKINQPEAVKAELPVTPEPKEQTGVSSKAPEIPTKHQPSKQTMDMIRLIQNAIGASVTGRWDKVTNNAFIKYMNENYPIAMKNNVFVGTVIDDKGTRSGNTLADAWELIKEKQTSQQQLAQEMANKPPEQTGQASKVPTVKPNKSGQWHSKYFKITPELQTLLSQWENAHGAGTGQTLLDTFDRTPNQTQQELESFIKENLT